MSGREGERVRGYSRRNGGAMAANGHGGLLGIVM